MLRVSSLQGNMKMNLVGRLAHRLRFNSYIWQCSALLLCILVTPFLAGFYPIVRFTQEQIDIRLYSDHVWVTGTYVYNNPFPFPVIQALSIPFPVDSEHPRPIQIAAKQLSPIKKPIPIRFILGMHRFVLNFQTREEVTIQVRSRQHAPKKTASYILTTTKSWKRPLTHGIYRLIPEGVKIVSTNYPNGSRDSSGFCFQRKTFMPREDWHFSWE